MNVQQVIASLVVAITWQVTAHGQEAASVTFGHRSPRLGEQVEQNVGVRMQLRTRARRGEEILEQSKSSVARDQHRVVTATQVVDDRVVGASVHFLGASVTHNDEAEQAPVVGKTYLCQREGEKLRVTMPDGLIPPMEEFTVVARAMETLGTPSPMASFLAGKQVAVGETLELPTEIAKRALGFDDRLGSVERFQLKLIKIVHIERSLVARFDAEIEAIGAGSGQMRLVIEGPVSIEAASCRILSAELSGPIAMMQSRGGRTGGYLIDSAGVLSLKTAARFRDTAR